MKIAIVGFGKIARDQHVAAIERTPGIMLAAIASPGADSAGLPCYPDITTLLAVEPDIEAVALCQPPQVRYTAASQAIAAGRHLFLEKPPGATLSEIAELEASAERSGVTLFASWHSRFAAGVEPARAWLRDKAIRSIRIDWKEDVRHWHPGQQWIWEPGGLGVFDPGINALSILTRLLRQPVRLVDAALVLPANRDAPIAADLHMRTADDIPIVAAFDWRQTGTPTWDIVVDTHSGTLRLVHGGNALFIDDQPVSLPPEAEYSALYARFMRLIEEGCSDVDIAPLRLVADAYLVGRRSATSSFED